MEFNAGAAAELSIVQDLSLLSGSTLEMDLFAGGVSDQIHLLSGGHLEVGSGATLLLSLVDFAPVGMESWTIFTGDPLSISGSFSLVLPELSEGLSWDISAFNEVGGWELRAIPEPGESLLLLCGAAVVVMALRQRKLKSVALGVAAGLPLVVQPAQAGWELSRADTAESLSALCFAEGQAGMAVTSGGVVFQLREGAWEKSLPEAPLAGKGAVRGCAWMGNDEFWIGSAGLSQEARGIFVLKEGAWSLLPMAGIPNPRINALWKDDEAKVLLVAMAKGQIARWDGASWSLSNLRRPTDFTAIHGSDVNNIWAVGHGGLVAQSDDGGVTWMDISVPAALSGAKWQGVYALAADRVWMVGREGEIGFWNGSEVEVQSLASPRILRGVLAVSDQEIYIIGSAVGPKSPGLLMRSSGNGAWEDVTTSLTGYGTLNTIAKDAQGALYIAGNEGVILRASQP